MTHSDPDALAMLALGDPEVDEADVEHVLSCTECRSELDRLMRVTRAARENGPVDFEVVEPSTAVWEGIRAQILAGGPGASTPAAPPTATVDASGDVAARDQRAVGRPGNRGDAAGPGRGAASGGRGRRVGVIAGAAVAVAAVLVAAFVFLRPTPPQVEAQAALAGLPAWSTSSGTATMEREADGSTVLAIALDSPAVDSGGSDFREVWLMDSTLTKSISVGLLDGRSGRFVMPPNIAAADYPVVDISQQPLNGDPAHSGDSIVRGKLAASH